MKASASCSLNAAFAQDQAPQPLISAPPQLSGRGAQIDTEQRLGDIKKVYVGELGSGDGSQLIRENLINRLVQSGVFSVVDSPSEADAIMSGIGELHSGNSFRAGGQAHSASDLLGGGYQSHGSFSAAGGTVYSASLTVRLTGKSKQILWTSQCRPGRVSQQPTDTTANGAFGAGQGIGMAIGSLAKRALHRSGSPVSPSPDNTVSYVADDAVKSLIKAFRKDQTAIQIGYKASANN